MLALYAVAFAFGGLPMIYMGDELGLRNDARWAEDVAHAGDNRWMHRPRMDWEAAGRRHDPVTVEGRLWAGLSELARLRRSTRAVHAEARCEPFWTGSEHVLGLWRERGEDGLRLLVNFSAQPQDTLGPYEYRWEAS
jgi:amylosucrase